MQSDMILENTKEQLKKIFDDLVVSNLNANIEEKSKCQNDTINSLVNKIEEQQSILMDMSNVVNKNKQYLNGIQNDLSCVNDMTEGIEKKLDSKAKVLYEHQGEIKKIDGDVYNNLLIMHDTINSVLEREIELSNRIDNLSKQGHFQKMINLITLFIVFLESFIIVLMCIV